MVYDPEQMVWHGNEADAARFAGLEVRASGTPSKTAAGTTAGARARVALDAEAVRRLRDAERAHHESMAAWPPGRRYGHDHLVLIRDVRRDPQARARGTRAQNSIMGTHRLPSWWWTSRRLRPSALVVVL
jgi:hypothetical protein